MNRPESGMRPKHGFELLQNLFAQCDQLFVIRLGHSQSPPQSLIQPVRCAAQPSLACHAIAFGDGASRRKLNEGGSSLACPADSSRRSGTKTETNFGSYLSS